MEILSYMNGIATFFISMDEFLPLGRASLWPFAQAIVDRYDFKAAGQASQLDGNAPDEPTFQNGQFEFAAQTTPVLQLRFSGNRIAVNCSRTDQAEAFFDEITEYLRSEFSFRQSKRKISVAYTSAVVFSPGRRFAENVQVFSDLSKVISAGFSDMNQEGDFYLQSARFAGVTKLGDQLQNSSFVIEERAGRPNGTDWLYSLASMKTEVHVKTLERMHERLQTFQSQPT